MRLAQSRLGIVTSLGSAGRGVSRCVEALPVSVRAAKFGAAAVGGFAGISVLRSLFSSARRCKVAPKSAVSGSPPPAPAPGVWHGVFHQLVPLLLVSLSRHYLLREHTPVLARLVPVIERLFKK